MKLLRNIHCFFFSRSLGLQLCKIYFFFLRALLTTEHHESMDIPLFSSYEHIVLTILAKDTRYGEAHKVNVMQLLDMIRHTPRGRTKEVNGPAKQR